MTKDELVDISGVDSALKMGHGGGINATRTEKDAF